VGDRKVQTGSSQQHDEQRQAARNGARLLLLAVLVGLASGIATFTFVVVDHYGVVFLWEDLPALLPLVPGWALIAGVVVATTTIATLIVLACKGRPFDTGAAEAEFGAEGRMGYRRILPGTAYALTSLFSGAAIGPEAPLVDINGGLGTLIADRFGVSKDQVRVMTYAGVAGAFSAFFGAAPIGALLAIELINPKSLAINRTDLVAGLASGASAWAIYELLGGHKIAPIFQFPDYQGLAMIDLGYAAILGAVAGAAGLLYGMAFAKTRVALLPLRERPVFAGLAGGAATLVVALVAPLLLFSGQTEVPELIARSAGLGVLVLLALGVGKLAFSIWGLSTAYFGGPLFPLMFAATCFGLALHEVIPAIPQGVAVMAFIAGMVVAATVAPLSITVFLALIGDPALVSVIAIAAVAAYVVRQAIAPTIPGVYRDYGGPSADTAGSESS